MADFDAMDDLTREQITSPWWTTKPKPEPMTPSRYLVQLHAAQVDDGLHPCPECGGVDDHRAGCAWVWAATADQAEVADE